jgi:hypothetical protein
MDGWQRLDARAMRPVTPSWAALEPNGSISWGLLFKPHGQLKLTLLALCINIATL